MATWNRPMQRGAASVPVQRQPYRQPAPRSQEPAIPFLPFNVAKRSVMEHKARNPHRRFINDQLMSVVAHWVDDTTPLEEKLMEHVSVVVNNNDTVPHVDDVDIDDHVNVYAFLTTGFPSDDKVPQHVLTRIDVYAATHMGTEGRALTPYGGKAPKGSDESLIKALTEMVESQCGADLSGVKWSKLLEMKYADKPTTIFFVPHLWDLPEKKIELKAQAKETEEEYEVMEEVEVEVDEEETKEEAEKKEGEGEEKKEGEGEEKKEGEEAKDAEPPKKKTKKEKQKVKKTRVNKTKTMQPVKHTMANLHDFNLQTTTANSTVELCSAADAFDEWAKRALATKMVAILSEKKEEAQAKAEENKKKAELEASRKRKRQEEEAECKKARLEKEEKLKSQWAEDDEGKTDEEKREAMKERESQLAELREEERRKIAELTSSDRDTKAAGGEGPLARKQQVKNQHIFHLFQYFDRSKGFAGNSTSIARERLINYLLCLDGERTLGECTDLATLGNPSMKRSPLNYHILSLEEKVVETEGEKDEGKKEEKEEDKMATDAQ